MTSDDAALFHITPARADWTPGRVEQGLQTAIKAGRDSGTLVDEDLGLIGSALAGARAIDVAEWAGGVKAGYLIAQLMTPYRETLAALRLPAAVQPADGPRAPAAGGSDASSSLRDLFGTAGT